MKLNKGVDRGQGWEPLKGYEKTFNWYYGNYRRYQNEEERKQMKEFSEMISGILREAGV